MVRPVGKPFSGTAPGALLAGMDTRLPQGTKCDIQTMAELSFVTATKMQRAAKRLLNQVQGRQLFTDVERADDPIVLQIAYRMRDELKNLEAMSPTDVDQEIAISKNKISVLAGMGAIMQAAMSEVSKVTVNTAKTAIEAQKLMLLAEKMKTQQGEDMSDAELAE